MKHMQLLAAALLAASTAQAEPPAATEVDATASTGTIDGAPYRIEMPAEWNGKLVMLFHGYEPVGAPREDPWPRMPGHGIEVFLSRGYAVALSGYSAQGWAVEEALEDSKRLRAHFESVHGKPGRAYAVGYSMGGHLTLAALEQRPEAFDGGLSLCGANMPATEVFAMAVAALAGFDARFPGVLALGPGGLADPASPPVVDSDAIAAALQADAAKAALLSEQIGIKADHLSGTLWLYYAVLREMVDRAGGFPVDNRDTQYSGFADAEWLNDAVRRYAGDPAAMAYVRAHSTPTGQIEDPVIALSNAYDDIIPARYDGHYREVADRAGRSDLFVRLAPRGSGHCSFTDEQVATAFDALTGWVEDGQRPAATRSAIPATDQ